MPHSVTKCSCGQILAQCRCPSPDKPVTVLKHACGKCKVELVKLAIAEAELKKSNPHV